MNMPSVYVFELEQPIGIGGWGAVIIFSNDRNFRLNTYNGNQASDSTEIIMLV